MANGKENGIVLSYIHRILDFFFDSDVKGMIARSVATLGMRISFSANVLLGFGLNAYLQEAVDKVAWQPGLGVLFGAEVL